MNDLDPSEALGQSFDPGSDAPAPESGAPPLAPPAAAAPVADQFYDVKVGGQTRKVPLAELLSGYSRTQDYTQKTMALAEERRQIQAAIQGERTQVRDFLSKRENVQQLLDYLHSQSSPGDPSQPGQALTAQQLQAALAAERARQAEDRQSMVQEMELKQMETGYRNDIDAHIKGILDQHPELKPLRGIAQSLKQAALEQEPATIDEAKQFIQQAAIEQAASIRAHFTEQAKVSALAKTNLTMKGTEPPGGAAPLPTARGNFKLGDPRLTQDASEYLKQLLNADK